MNQSSKPRIAVLGAGPIGLEAALYGKKLGYPVTVFEAGQVGEYVRHWGHVKLFSPFGMNSTALGRTAIRKNQSNHEFPTDSNCITGKEHLECYINPLAESEELHACLQANTKVLHIGRHGFFKGEAIGDKSRGNKPFRLLVLKERKREQIEEADVILDCTGTYGQHRWLGQDGIPAIGERIAKTHISYHLDDVLGKKRDQYAGKNILVIGAGYSAATTVCNLAKLAEEHSDTWVIWSARSPKTQPIQRIANDPLKERDRLAARANQIATRMDANVEFHPKTQVEAVRGDQEQGFKVTVCNGNDTSTWEADRIIGNVGYMPNNEMYRELQIHECYATQGPIKLAAALLGQKGGDCLGQTNPGPDTLKNPEPSYYILGAKSYGRNSLFLMRMGFEQVRDVYRLITGKANLDLYKQ